MPTAFLSCGLGRDLSRLTQLIVVSDCPARYAQMLTGSMLHLRISSGSRLLVVVPHPVGGAMMGGGLRFRCTLRRRRRGRVGSLNKSG